MKKLLVIFAIFILPFSSFAGMKINPKVSYNLYDYDSGSKVDASGVGFGLGVGYSFIGLYTMLEYETATLSIDSTGADDETVNNLNFIVGYEFPILLNVWGGYIFDSDFGNLEGNGTKFGIGYSAAPMVQLYLEIVNIEYDKLSGATLSTKRKLSGHQIGVQIPF